MPAPRGVPNREVGLYLEHAREMLEVASHNLADGFYGSAINRAYYAVFPWHCPPGQVYAANALQATQGLARSKHSGVIAAFREHFVKTGLIENAYSDIYGRVMDNRRVSDYEIEIPVEVGIAERALIDARRFVERVQQHLQREGLQ